MNFLAFITFPYRPGLVNNYEWSWSAKMHEKHTIKIPSFPMGSCVVLWIMDDVEKAPGKIDFRDLILSHPHAVIFYGKDPDFWEEILDEDITWASVNGEIDESLLILTISEDRNIRSEKHAKAEARTFCYRSDEPYEPLDIFVFTVSNRLNTGA